MVDDLGPPGYFIKEAPLLPATAALFYGATGEVDEAWGRIFRGHPLADRIFYLASELGDFSVIFWPLKRMSPRSSSFLRNTRPIVDRSPFSSRPTKKVRRPTAP